MINKNLKMLFLDIETLPCLGVFWRPGQNQHIVHDQIIKDSMILSVHWKWLGESKVHHVHCGFPPADFQLLLKVQDLITNDAEIIVTQNGDKFDLPWIQWRLAVNGLT